MKPGTTGVAPERGDLGAPPRQCGRCRLSFDGDATLHPAVQSGWWLCPLCRSALLVRTK